MGFTTVTGQDPDASGSFVFEGWKGSLHRPQKVLDVVNRLGRTGSTAQVSFKKGQDSLVYGTYFGDDSIFADIDDIEQLQGTLVTVAVSDGPTYTNVLCKSVSVGLVKGIVPYTGRGTAFDHVADVSFIFEVQAD